MELRVVACLSQDEFLCEVYRKGGDLHGEVAARLYGPDYTHDERAMSKRLVFGWLYGGEVVHIAGKLGMNPQAAAEIGAAWEEALAGVTRWRKEQKRLVTERGYVLSYFGRRRRFPVLTDENIGEVLREAVNFPVQSTASDILLQAQALVWRELQGRPGRPQIIMNIHDALVVEVAEEEAERIASLTCQWFSDVAEGAFHQQLPFPAEGSVGKSLADFLGK